MGGAVGTTPLAPSLALHCLLCTVPRPVPHVLMTWKTCIGVLQHVYSWYSDDV